MPYVFSPINPDQDQDQDGSIINVVKQDCLDSLSFEIKFENELLKEALS